MLFHIIAPYDRLPAWSCGLYTGIHGVASFVDKLYYIVLDQRPKLTKFFVTVTGVAVGPSLFPVSNTSASVAIFDVYPVSSRTINSMEN